MKRSRKVILLVLVLLIVGASWLGANQLAQKEAVVETQEAIQVLGGGQVTRMRFDAGDQSLALTQREGTWQVEDDQAFPLDQDQAGEYAQLLSSLTATRRITGGAQLADYGLETPAFTMDVTLEDGAQVTLSMGDYNALTGEYYLKRGDQQDIYTVEASLSDLFDLEKADLARLMDLSALITPVKVSLEGAFTLTADENGKWMTGADEEADQEAASALVGAAQYLSIDHLVDWTGATALEKPVNLVVEDQDGSRISLLIGQQVGEERLIAQTEAPQLIYAVPAEELEGLLSATDQSLAAQDEETTGNDPGQTPPPEENGQADAAEGAAP